MDVAGISLDNEHSSDELDLLVKDEFPYPVAVNYRKMLEFESWEAKTRRCIEIFEYGIRAVTFGLLTQYLIRDLHQVSDPELDRKLYRSLPSPTLGQWVEFLFLCLRAYQDKQNLFFTNELYELYWDVSKDPHQQRKGVRGPFVKLVEIRNDLAHRIAPEGEEAWEELGKDVLNNLRKVLAYFHFFHKYDLVRIVKKRGEEYEYERFTGQEVTTHSEILKGKEELRPGWFYLSRQDRSVLRLHPLMIFWTSEEETDWIGDEASDVALYDRLLKETVEYVATVVRRMIKERDVELVAQFEQLIYHNLEDIKLARKRTVFSWAGLVQAARDLTLEGMAGVHEKYQKNLYLQRGNVFGQFQEFLASDDGCFVLTGKSGVGKSNFVLSLVDEFSDRDDLALLMYNAARLSIPNSVVEMINQDLAKHLILEGENIEDLLRDLEQQSVLHDKKLIIVFDAINENADGKALLRKIDELVNNMRYPWLKVVITSRPEAWQIIKRGIPLATERYFRAKDTDDIGVELQEFEVKLELFKRDELRDVYEKYGQVFGLQTKYDDLKPSIREVLRDPLVLRLVAEIYRNRAIPEDIRVNDIYEFYVNRLIDTERLYQKDIFLLEREIMPLMLAEGHYDNKVSEAQIHNVQTRDGRPLWELLYSDDYLSSGQQVNESFMRLVETEILVELGGGLDRAIGFKYERFYEFFGGRQLHQASKEAPDLHRFYENVASALPDHVYLWGAMVQALVLKLKEGEARSLVIDLAPKSESNRLLYSAMVTALTQFGEDHRTEAEEYIWELIGELTPAPWTFFGAFWRLIRPPKHDPLESISHKRIAIEAAGQLKMTKLLEEVAAEPEPRIRNAASQQTFYLWKRDHADGFKVLDGLSHRITNHGLPDFGVAESMLGISGAILGLEHGDEEVLTELLAIGRRALRDIFWLGDENQSRLRRALIGFLYNQIVSTILRFVLRIMSGWGEHAWASYDGMANIFSLSNEQKVLVRSFIPFLDPDEPGFENRLSDMIIIEDWGDQLSQAVVEFAILGHGVRDFDKTYSIVKKLTEYAMSSTPPRFWIPGPIWNLWQSSMRIDNPTPEFLSLCEQANDAIQKDPSAWEEKAQKERPVPVTSDNRVAGLGPLIGAYSTYKKDSFPDLVIDCLERAMDAQDNEYLKLYINQELTILFEVGMFQAAVRGLKPIAHYENIEVQTAIINFLVRIRQNEPEFIEDLLLQGEFPQAIVDRVLATPTSESLIDLVTYQLAVVIYDLFILGPEPLRFELQWLISQALNLSNPRDWFSLIIKELLNALTGEIVFKVPNDAPSRRLLNGDFSFTKQG